MSGGAAQASATPSATATASPSPSPTDSPTPSNSPTPTPDLGPTPLPAGLAYADLDGVAAPVDAAHGMPLAIMIDDQQQARPQSGISSASIVYQLPIDLPESAHVPVQG